MHIVIAHTHTTVEHLVFLTGNRTSDVKAPMCRLFRFLTLVPPSGGLKKHTLWQTPPGNRDERAESNTDCTNFHWNFVLLCQMLSDQLELCYFHNHIRSFHIAALTPHIWNLSFSTVSSTTLLNWSYKLAKTDTNDTQKWREMNPDRHFASNHVQWHNNIFALESKPVVWNHDWIFDKSFWSNWFGGICRHTQALGRASDNREHERVDRYQRNVNFALQMCGWLKNNSQVYRNKQTVRKENECSPNVPTKNSNFIWYIWFVCFDMSLFTALE